MLINEGKINFEYKKISEVAKTPLYFPIFQRFYDWKIKEAYPLQEDILSAIDEPEKELYLLDFIWYIDEEKTYIADGQQRIVTLNLLYKAINEVIEDKELNIKKIELFKLSYDEETFDKKYQTSFNMPFGIKAPFKKMFIHWKEFITNHKDRIEDIIGVLMNQTYVYMRQVEDADAAYTIFEQINTGGKPLSKKEVIKTAVDQYSKKYSIPVNYKDDKELSNIFQGYYKLKRNDSSSLATISIMDFLKKDIICDKTHFKDFANYVTATKDLQTYPIAIVIDDYLNRKPILNLINVMAGVGINLRTQKDYVEKIIIPLCLLSMVMTIKGSNPGGIIKGLYAGLIEDVKEKKSVDTLQEELVEFINRNGNICKITFEEFRDGLGPQTKLSLKTKKGLLILDVILKNTSSDLIMENINVEHVYPQKPHPDWGRNGWPLEKNKQKELFTNIGNLVLLNGSVNKEISNKYIDEKKPAFDKIIQKDRSLQTQMNTIDLNQFTMGGTVGERYITKRQNDIAEIVYNDFELAKTMIVKTSLY